MTSEQRNFVAADSPAETSVPSPDGSGALSTFRICDFTGQLAGAGATKWLAALGAEVIRIEDPVRQGRWDILRGGPPYKDGERGLDRGGAFNNHNAGKYGITLNLRDERAKDILARLIEISDVVSENFAKGVLERWGFGYDRMREIRGDIIYVSNCGFGHVGPYSDFKTWGPIVQAVSGLTFTNGLPDREPAGWGYSYMDHTGGYYMAIAILLALVHRQRTGEGQWVDLACTESALALHGPALLDWTVNGRPSRRDGSPHSNRNAWPPMAPHGIYPCKGDDEWVAIACRGDGDWWRLAGLIAEPWCSEPGFAVHAGRVANQDALDTHLERWTSGRGKFDVQERLRAADVPVAAVQKPQERIDLDPSTEGFGLWPTVQHTVMGDVRVDGQPVHFSETDWEYPRAGPCLGEHNEEVLTSLLGFTPEEVATLAEEGVI
ncbi:MAG: CoA transferase [Gammaproteobacteria bacterium]|nr:CoA transferase [Gammaproteobacteria bacterium]